ncbi:MAG: nucleotidyltransferase family protein [Thermoanaerobaculia bacterium]
MRAGLLPGARAERSWQRWRAATGGAADTASRRLLPLAEWNLRRIAGRLPAPEEPGFVETEWLLNEGRIEAAAAVLRELARRGLSPVVLKGLALSHLFYPHRALRPMADIDLLLSPEQFEQGRTALSELGWRAVGGDPASRLKHLHGLAYERAGAPELDLHAHALLECCSPDADRSFLARAVRFELSGVQARTLSPADHLLCLCVHGLRWSTAPAIHWAADAVMLLRCVGEELDWDVLVAEAFQRDLALPVARALRLIQEELEADVDEEALSRLARGSRGWLARLEFAARVAPLGLAAGLFLHWRDLARERREASAIKRLWLFPGYLRELWGLDRSWKVPLEAARRSLARSSAAPRAD